MKMKRLLIGFMAASFAITSLGISAAAQPAETTINAELAHTASSIIGESAQSDAQTNGITAGYDRAEERFNYSRASGTYSAWTAEAYADFTFSIPENATVTSAELEIYCKHPSSSNNRKLWVDYLTGGYDEIDLTKAAEAASAYGENATRLSEQNLSTSYQKFTVDAIAAVRANKDKGRVVFAVSGSNSWCYLAGKGGVDENVAEPALKITYTVNTRPVLGDEAQTQDLLADKTAN